MTKDTDIIALRQPESFDDPLTEIARASARHLPSVPTLIPSSFERRLSDALFGGSIFATTAALRSGEYAKSSSCPARLRS